MTGGAARERGVRLGDALPCVEALRGALTEAGGGAWVVGPTLLEFDAGRPPPNALVWTDASRTAITEHLGQAVPIDAAGRVFRVVWEDQLCFIRSLATPIDDALARMPFGVLAVGLEAGTGALRDPVGGGRDLADRRLRGRADAKTLARRDPLVALRAASLVARHGLRFDADEARAFAHALPALEAAPAAHRASLLGSILQTRSPSAALSLLDAAGLRRRWLGAESSLEASAFDTLPTDAAVRLLAWCQPHPVAGLLRRIRVGAGLRARLVRLAEHHPLDERHSNTRPRTVRRLLERIGEDDFDALIALRRAELERAPRPDARARLDALADARRALSTAEVERIGLEVGGRDLIEALGIEPGPPIGQLLAQLETEVIAGRIENDRGALLQRAEAIRRDGD